jgi:hypothetical protein
MISSPIVSVYCVTRTNVTNYMLQTRQMSAADATMHAEDATNACCRYDNAYYRCGK